MCCNVGWGLTFFCGEKEKNKINSIKFALSCQKLNSFLFFILSISYQSVVSSFYTCCQRLGVWRVREREFRFRRTTKSPQTGDEAPKFPICPHWLHPLLQGVIYLFLFKGSNVIFSKISVPSEKYGFLSINITLG